MKENVFILSCYSSLRGLIYAQAFRDFNSALLTLESDLEDDVESGRWNVVKANDMSFAGKVTVVTRSTDSDVENEYNITPSGVYTGIPKL